MKTKIFYIITKGNWGGAQRYVYDLATSLPKDRFEVSVVCGEGKILEEKLSGAGIRVIRLPQLARDLHISKDLLVLFALIKLFREEKPDIIHLNSSKIGGLGGLAGRLSGVRKIIFTGHGWAFNEKRPAWQKSAIYFLHWLTIAFSTTTIAVSEKTKKDILKLPFIDNKVRVIHNGSDDIKFLSQPMARAALESKDLDLRMASKESLWIGTVSELHKNKGLDYMIEAIALLRKDMSGIPPFLFAAIGEGSERPHLEKMIKDKNVEDVVFLIGQMDEARSQLKAFNILTLTSRTEALPYFLLEAGQASLPVIANAVGGIPEIIEQLKSGILVKPNHPKELSDALSLLLRDEEKRKTLGGALHERVHAKFSLEKMLADTIQIYQKK